MKKVFLIFLIVFGYSLVSAASVSKYAVNIQCDFDKPAKIGSITIPNTNELSASLVPGKGERGQVILATMPTLTIGGNHYVGQPNMVVWSGWQTSKCPSGILYGPKCFEVFAANEFIRSQGLSAILKFHTETYDGINFQTPTSTSFILYNSVGLAVTVYFSESDVGSLVPYKMQTVSGGQPIDCAMSIR